MSWTFTRKRRNIDDFEVPRLSLAKLRYEQFESAVPKIGEVSKSTTSNQANLGRLTTRHRRHILKKKRKKHLGARIYPNLAFEGPTGKKLAPSYAERRRTLRAIKSMNAPSMSSRSSSTKKYLSPTRPINKSSVFRVDSKSSTFSGSRSRPQSRHKSPPTRPHSRQGSTSRPHSRASNYRLSRTPSRLYGRNTPIRRRRRRKKRKKLTYTRVPQKSNQLVVDAEEVNEQKKEDDFEQKQKLKAIPPRPTEFLPAPNEDSEPMSRILSRKPLKRLPFSEQSPFIIRDNVIQQLKNTMDKPNLWARGLLTQNLESSFYQEFEGNDESGRKLDTNEMKYIDLEKGKVPERKTGSSDFTLESSIYGKLKRPNTVPARMVGCQKKLDFSRKSRTFRPTENSDKNGTNGSFELVLPSISDDHKLLTDRVKMEKVLSPDDEMKRGKGRMRGFGLEITPYLSDVYYDDNLELEISRLFAGKYALANGGRKLRVRPNTVPSKKIRMKRRNDPNRFLEQLKKEFDLMSL